MTMVSDVSGSTGDGGFWRGLKVQGNVIGALLMRELHTRYGRENVGYLWIFLEPMTLAGAVALLHVGSGSSHTTSIHPVPFAILGYTIFIMFRGMVTRADGALESNMPLLYHRRVTIFDMMFARALLEGAGTIVTYIVLIAFVIAIGMATLPARPLELLTGVGLMFWFSFAVSLLICAWTHDNRLVARFVHPVTYILMPLSGAFYQLSWIPEPYRSWLRWFPMPTIFELLRYGQFQSAKDTYVDVGYVAGWCLLLTYAGLVSIRATRRHIHLR
ncbi:ABC transporter permease [Sphingomonas sp. BK345]|uniref:ABC transporter permease n=1 Tax=Sphingomonas sp. BK345 TaxID=2586980 RepID=UPI0017D7170C|nr:ABC transporter permease [Sphingomonas sp. BK345]MBB3475458.1 capsular polysaccharide transport system permease protein [Sphingomonas sp. BK345]